MRFFLLGVPMESKTDIVKKVLTSVETGHAKDIAGYLADSVTFAWNKPSDLKNEYLVAFFKNLLRAMPDFRFGATDVREEGDRIHAVLHVSATNTGMLNFPGIGIHSIPSTGKRAVLPAESMEIVMKENKIIKITVSQVPGGGFAGLMKQLGIQMPELARV